MKKKVSLEELISEVVKKEFDPFNNGLFALIQVDENNTETIKVHRIWSIELANNQVEFVTSDYKKRKLDFDFGDYFFTIEK